MADRNQRAVAYAASYGVIDDAELRRARPKEREAVAAKLLAAAQSDPAKAGFFRRHAATFRTILGTLAPERPSPGRKPPGPKIDPPRKLAVVATHFNPAGYERRRTNYQRFAAHIADAGLDLWTAEAHYGTPELPATERTFHFLAGANMWHKERLFNLAIDRLPPEYDAVAWMDADLLYDDPAWPTAICEALSLWPVVQAFETIIWLDENDQETPWNEGKSRKHALAVRSGGMPGGSFASRREAIRAMGGLWDANICGCGDWVMAEAFRGNLRVLPKYTLAWARRAFAVAGGLGFVPLVVRHLWHGSRADRNYGPRWKFMQAIGFDPQRDLQASENGLWEWSDKDPVELRLYLDYYFRARREDG